MKSRFFRVAVCASLVVAALLYGMWSARHGLPPYPWLRDLRGRITASGTPGQRSRSIAEEYLQTDPSRILSIENADDAEALRKRLLTYLWGEAALPSRLPSAVEEGVSDPRFADIPPLERIDKLTVAMEFGLRSYLYHFHPQRPNGRVVLYHQGHRGGFILGKAQIARFLDEGYAVIAISMPLKGPNPQPTIELPRLGRLKLTTHDQMKFLAPEHGHPIRYFVEPVVVALNYLEEAEACSTVAMVGISGGGWTTTLAAAVDPRIRWSFPVAGSYPIYLRSDSRRDWGDYEQTEPGIYETANYLELYVLGSSGPGRKQLQMFNEFDPCCFAGSKWKTYAGVVTRRVHRLGEGEFAVMMDSSHRLHAISDQAMDRILDELRSVGE